MENNERPPYIDRRAFAARTVGAAALAVVSFQRNLFAGASMVLPDGPTGHNMMVVGQKTVYLSHLPMFDKLNPQKTQFATPHRFQVLLEASLTGPSSKPDDTYFKDRAANPTVRMYTLSPEPFVLSTLFLPTIETATRRSFKAGMFRGHLERTGSANILQNVTVTVRRVIHAHEFGVKDVRPAQLEYVLFGKGDELFLSHFISAPPDFDQIVPVKVTGRTFTEQELNQGPRITIPDRKNTSVQRLMEKTDVAAVAKIGKGAGMPIQIQAARELYFEDGELLIPPKFPQTAEEKKAGFTEEMR
jgi:hypothetical protein